MLGNGFGDVLSSGLLLSFLLLLLVTLLESREKLKRHGEEKSFSLLSWFFLLHSCARRKIANEEQATRREKKVCGTKILRRRLIKKIISDLISICSNVILPLRKRILFDFFFIIVIISIDWASYIVRKTFMCVTKNRFLWSGKSTDKFMERWPIRLFRVSFNCKLCRRTCRWWIIWSD